MRYLLLLFAVLSIASCRCPELTVGVTERTDSTTTSSRTVDTTTTHIVDTTKMGPVTFSGTIDLDSVCEELRRIRLAGQDSATIEVTPVAKPNTPTKPKSSSIGVKIGSSGKAQIDCKTDSLIRVTDSLTILVIIKDSIITKVNHDKQTVIKEEVPIRDWWYKTWRGIAIFYLCVTLIFILAKWAGSYTKPFG